MTIREALQSLLEYENDNLLNKTLIDRGVSNTKATYTAANQQVVELAAADIYLWLCGHPILKEGSRYIDYSKGTLLSMRRGILRKWNLEPAEVTIDGTQIW